MAIKGKTTSTRLSVLMKPPRSFEIGQTRKSRLVHAHKVAPIFLLLKLIICNCCPAKATRLIVGLQYLKHMYGLVR
jgi:hypothetical protein